jgi:UV DNA damage endonuclease
MNTNYANIPMIKLKPILLSKGISPKGLTKTNIVAILNRIHKYPNIKNKIKLGLCCINTELRKENIFCSRSCIQKNFSISKVQDLALQNVRDICKLIEYNHQHNITCLRLSSDMFPHFTNPNVEPYTLDFAKADLIKAGKLIKKYNHRVLFHPAQFCQVGTPKPQVFTKTIRELKFHADILDIMNIDSNGVLIVHGGGIFNDKSATIDRWVKQFKLLPQNVKNRLCIEHCEYCYNVDDVLLIGNKCNIPVVFDTHHYSCYNIQYPNSKVSAPDIIIPKVIKTWSDRIPVFHISEQGNGRLGNHSDYIETIPEYLLQYLNDTPNDFYINLEVEAKMKEQAIFKLYKKYPDIFT